MADANSAEVALHKARQDLNAVKLLLLALIVDVAQTAPTPQGARAKVDSIRDAAIGGAGSSTYLDPTTQEEWKSAVTAEIKAICDAIKFG